MPGRNWTSSGDEYRFGFNGMEMDDEMKGDGNSLDFGARIYDSRLGRWLSIDPLYKDYPKLSPYISFANNPIFCIDIDGRIIKPIWKSDFYDSEHYKQFIKNYDDLKKAVVMFSNIIHQLQESSEYFEFKEKNFYKTLGAILSGFDPGSRGSFERRDGRFFSEHKIFLNNYTSFGNGENSFLNGVRHKATLFEEVFHAGQYLYYSGVGQEITNIQKEVEAKVAKAYTGTFSKEEGYIKEFADNYYVREYFNAIENGTEFDGNVQIGYDAALYKLADEVYDIYKEFWGNAGEEFLEKNNPNNNEFDNGYLKSEIKNK